MFNSPFEPHIGFISIDIERSKLKPLHISERECLSSNLNDRRLLQFQAGRTAAHEALQQIEGSSDSPITRGDKGEPMWPENCCGSITHHGDWAIAVAALKSKVLSIGIDLESGTRELRQDIQKRIAHPEEREWIEAGESISERAIMIFSAKESIYKALYPLTAEFMEFKDALVKWDEEENSFRATLTRKISRDYSDGTTVHGICTKQQGYILTGVTIPSTKL